MPPRFPRRLLTPGEFVVLTRNPHWATVIGPVLALAVALVAQLWLPGQLPFSQTVGFFLVAVFVLAAVVWALARFLSWRYTTYTITNQRLIVRAGVINRTGTEIPIDALVNVAFSATLIERLVGAGDLHIESAGATGRVSYDNIKDPEGTQSLLYRLRDLASDATEPAPAQLLQSLASQKLISTGEMRASLAQLETTER